MLDFMWLIIYGNERESDINVIVLTLNLSKSVSQTVSQSQSDSKVALNENLFTVLFNITVSVYCV